MSKAEERALEFYPMKDYNKEPNYIHSCDSKMLDEVYRQVFMVGYEQAEKDLKERFIQFVHSHYPINYTVWIQDFKKAMEDEK